MFLKDCGSVVMLLGRFGNKHMKVLVTGSEGYIGVPLVQALIHSGHNVTGLDTCFYSGGWLYPYNKQEYDLIKKDIRAATVQDLEGFDAICHLAELSNDPLGQNNPEITYTINHLGTASLAEKAKEAGVKRFVYMSSCSVYGASEEVRDEKSPVNPLTEYAKCKVLNEKFLTKIANEHFSPVFLRNATVFGPSPRLRFDLAVNNLTGLAFTTHEIKMDSDGSPWRPFVHVEDVARAIICMLAAPRDIIHNEVFNVGDSKSNYQIKEIAKIISEVIPDCKVSLNANGADKRNYKVNFDKINTKLPGFSCSKDIRVGVEELYEIFSSIALTKETFDSKDYTRLKQINYLKETGKINKDFYWRLHDK